MNERAIVKQPACAAAISASGLVPLPSPKRATNENGVSLSVPLWVAIVPAPSFAVPCQRAEALRCIVISFQVFVLNAQFRPRRASRQVASQSLTVAPMRYHSRRDACAEAPRLSRRQDPCPRRLT